MELRRIPTSSKLFLSHFAIGVTVALLVGGYIYLQARDELLERVRERLEGASATISSQIDAAELLHIDGADDLSDPAYLSLLERLRNFQRINQDIAFIYVMRRSGSEVRFVADSDMSEDQAIPGQSYANPPSELMVGFEKRNSDERVYRDSWGEFISGYAPLMNGKGEFLLGIDMRAGELSAKETGLRSAVLIAILASAILSVVLGKAISWQLSRPLQALIEQCEAILERGSDADEAPKAHGEMGSLIDQMNRLTDDLKRSRQMNRQRAEHLELEDREES